MKIIGVIPARYNSTRFKGKPLAVICGKPMIWWVYNQVIKVKAFEAVYVATDDERISNVCKQHNMKYIMTSVDHKTGTDRVGEVANKINADLYVNIQGDEPLIEPSTIETLVSECLKNKAISVINTMTKIRSTEDITSDSVVKVVTNERNEGIYLSRSPIPYPKNGENIQYYKHLGLYGLSREFLLFFTKTQRGNLEKIEDIEMMRFIENSIPIKFVEVPFDTVSVDKYEDIAKVEKIMGICKEE
jgi:3-deoxy-manno-octulosonate cytidylyltransferase (CMP-KDO synthetase)